MDIRTFGKGYDQFYQNAKAMGVQFIKGKVAKITEDEEKNPIVRVELVEQGRVIEQMHDLVVLSVGMRPAYNPLGTYGVNTADDGFVTLTCPNFAPAETERPGIFVAGAAGGPMDIVDSIITAGAAAAEAAAYIEMVRSAPSSSHRDRGLVHA
jgi:heterodisulfide reductase subunit A